MIAELIAKLAEFERDEDKKYYPRPSCSGPERCIRQMVYWGLGVLPAPLPGRSLLVFDDGNWHEELTKDWLRKSAYQVHSDQLDFQLGGTKYGQPGILLTGHIDWILTDALGKDYLCEHKAINHFTWQKYADGELPLDYLSQVSIYFAGLAGITKNLNDGLLLVKNKNTAQYLEMSLRYNHSTDTLTVGSIILSTGGTKDINRDFPGIVKASFDKFAEVNRLIAAKTLPHRQYDIEHWRCNYCQWAGECYKNYGEEFQAMATGADLSEINTELAYCNQLAAQQRDIKNELDERKEAVKARLKLMNVRQGRGATSEDGSYYIAEIKAMHRDAYTAEASDHEQLSIKKIKPKEIKK